MFRRPRRFGKSMVLSMLKYFFFGATELFQGLEIYNQDFTFEGFRWRPMNPKEHHFPPCPVITLDFSDIPHDGDFNDQLSTLLSSQAQACGLSNCTPIQGEQINFFFDRIVRALSQDPRNQWKSVVVLVDEYDFPVRNCTDSTKRSAILRSMTELFRTIKAHDSFIKYSFVTGIESHSYAGLYSGANNFVDLTYETELADLCGYTETETKKILGYFALPHDFETLRKKYN